MAKKQKTPDQKQPDSLGVIEIDNFGFFDVEFVSIILTKFKKSEYSATLLFHTNTENPEDVKAIHHELPIMSDKMTVIQTCVSGVILLYGREMLLDQVNVFDKNGEEVEIFSLSEFLEKQSGKKSSGKLINHG